MGMFTFDRRPAAGTVLLIGDHPFHLVATDDYTRLDGTPSALLRWESNCTRCGEVYEVTTGLSGQTPSRRCPACRAATRGGRIKRERGQLNIKIIPA